jgi:hypothetical protein
MTSTVDVLIETRGSGVIQLRKPTTIASVQGALALDLGARVEPPAVRPPASRAGDFEPANATRERLDAFVHRYLQAAVEIAIGDRPVRQVLRHCVPTVYDDLAERARRVSAAAGTTPNRGRGPSTLRPSVVTTRTSMVRRDALEASARVRHGHRSRAVAARFEEVGGRWQCVLMEWG